MTGLVSNKLVNYLKSTNTILKNTHQLLHYRSYNYDKSPGAQVLYRSHVCQCFSTTGLHTILNVYHVCLLTTSAACRAASHSLCNNYCKHSIASDVV